MESLDTAERREAEETIRRLRHELELVRAEADELARGNELLREQLEAR
jgi:hypothetical protein